jgi:hypothetical protein
MQTRIAVTVVAVFLIPVFASGPGTGNGRGPGQPSGPRPPLTPGPPHSGNGRNPAGGRRGGNSFGPPVWPVWPPVAPYSGLPFASPFSTPGLFPPQAPPTPVNVTIVPVQPPVPPVPMQPVATKASDDALDSAPKNVETFHFAQLPTPEPVVWNEYPAVVTFRSGGIYSITKHWVKNKKFYFVTPLGETLYVPVGQVDHIYPAIKSAETRR